MKPQKLHTLYLQWCKETKRNGSVITDAELQEFFEWVEGIIDENVNIQHTIECKVCGEPFSNSEEYYAHYDEKHNKS